jgi:hypothetical protein
MTVLTPLSEEHAAPVEAHRAGLTRVGWAPADELALNDWAEQGRRFGAIGRAVGWWIGDWLRYGNERWGERYVRAARITGYDVQTLMNMVYVASAYAPSQRHEALSWTHHAEVAALEPAEREALLARAESERLSARCLREELRRLRRVRAHLVSPPSAPQVERPTSRVCPHCGTAIELDEDGNVFEPSA